MEYENILMALKNGNVPSKGTKAICMGRDNEIAEFERILDMIEDDEKAIVKFVKGEYGAGKSFFLKVIEEMAFEKNFVVSWITLSNDVPFNKIDVVYKNIARQLRCKTGTSLEHIIERWITGLEYDSLDGDEDAFTKERIMYKAISDDLNETREYSNTFALVIQNYYRFRETKDDQIAKNAMAWLRGDFNIPFTEKRKFGVQGDVSKENALKFLEALSIFVKSIGYSGLVVLIDEAEFILNIARKDLRGIAYDYIRDIYDDCSAENFQSTLFVFAGTPEFFEDTKKGIPSYEALDDRLRDLLDTDYVDMRKPIIDLRGFEKDDLIAISKKLTSMHSEAYDWKAEDIMDDAISEIVDLHIQNAGLTGGKVTPRIFVRVFISVLDTVQQNQNEFNNTEDILKLFESREDEIDEDDFFDDFDDEEW